METITEFARQVRKNLQEHYGSGYTISTQEAVKNNGIPVTGIAIRKGEENMVPVMYLDDYFVDYQGGRKLDSILKEIRMRYEEGRLEKELDMGMVMDGKQALGKVCFKLIHRQENSRLLETVPHREYLDLAIIYYTGFDICGKEGASIVITNRLMKEWGVGEETLYKHAARNTPLLLKSTITTIAQKIKESLQLIGDMEMEEEFDSVDAMIMEEQGVGEPPMYVAGNVSGIFGASVMIYEGVLKAFSEKIGGDFYILPSSLHEVLFVSMQGVDEEELARMVREVNETQVAPEEVLSNHVYRYFADKECVEIVA